MTETATLPYASELFGVYQPLLGWRSQLLSRRFDAQRAQIHETVARRLLNAVHAPVGLQLIEGVAFNSYDVQVEPVRFASGVQPAIAASIDCGVARLLAEQLGERPPESWPAVITREHAGKLLNEVAGMVSRPGTLAPADDHPTVKAYLEAYVPVLAAALHRVVPEGDEAEAWRMLMRGIIDKEARIAGYLAFLAEQAPAVLTSLFFRAPQADAQRVAMTADPLLSFGDDDYRAVLSPIGVVHLYREYFFEFASFLGPPVGHVWLSPGGTVELVEVNTRRQVAERTTEVATELAQRSEAATQVQDDLADAVKDDNKSDVKFGVTNTAHYHVPVFEDTATASIALETAKATSRETTHKHMRQQSEKLASEIKRNFKTTFRTTSEVTDTTSKRYVIQNTTAGLVNYELRRKMRTVGVQVQDIGVQLCWHTFVDDPGKNLGLGQLVHIGEPPELADLVHPDQPALPEVKSEELVVEIPFVGIDTDDNDNAYTDGRETEVGALDATEHIEPDFPRKVAFAKPGYTLAQVTVDPQGSDAKVSIRDLLSDDGSSAGSFTVHLDYVHWHGHDQITVKTTLTWAPTDAARETVKAAYDQQVQQYTVERARRFKEAFLKASRERVTLASQIQPRPTETLREEERTVLYRALIRQLMGVGSDESKHVVSELVRSIFDVDKMLYFVAPEWWMPRLHRSAQHLGAETPPTTPSTTGTSTVATGGGSGHAMAVKGRLRDSAVMVQNVADIVGNIDDPSGPPAGKTPIPVENLVDWGGDTSPGRDNYYITEESAPARLGSSLGWLMQLDGDDLRNALLNSPWAKAVIPIRIGKERAATNWLRQAHVEGTDGLDADYIATPDDPAELRSTPAHTVTVAEALERLIDDIGEFDRRSRTPVMPDPTNPDDPRNHFAGSLPTEAVFEHGFYPLQGGVHFAEGQAIFSQWTEILPTDQVAAVAVEYDPTTPAVKIAEQP